MPRGFYRGYGWFGRGGGNPYPYCRFFPWLPRRWWAYPATAQQYIAPYPPAPYLPASTPPLMPPSFPGYSKEQETQMLTQQIQILETQLESLKKRFEELKT